MEDDEFRELVVDGAMTAVNLFDAEMVEALRACEKPFERVLELMRDKGTPTREAAVIVASMAMMAALERLTWGINLNES